VTPAFAFGHGLSYTTFDFGAINATDPQNIQLSVKNNGTCEGKEVVQLYISFPKGTDEPPRILKGFEKIHLNKDETKKLSFSLEKRDMSIYNVKKHDW
jgi:beta-glucosidase